MARRSGTVLVLLAILIALGAGLLLALSACGPLSPAGGTLSQPSEPTPVSPASGEGHSLPATLEAYVPPPTPEPWPTALPEPTATPRPTLEVGRVVRGTGNFPRLPVVAMATADRVLALYMVEGDTATLLAGFEEMSPKRPESEERYPAIFRVDARLSPSGRYVACRTFSGVDGSSALELVDTQEPHRVVLFQPNRDTTVPADAKGNHPFADRLTSMAWLDDEHILYTVQGPNNCAGGGPPADPPCEMPGELWVTDLSGVKQQLLAADRLFQVLGVSPDGQRAYFLRLGAEWVPAGPNEWYNLYSLDLTSGVTATLWPQADDAERYTGYTLLPFPGGDQRVLFRFRDVGNTVATTPPVIWMLDPGSGQADVIWTIAEGEALKGAMVYDTPVAYLWSPFSEQDFAYSGIWRVDLVAQESHLLRQESGDLLAWTAEGIVVHVRDDIQLLDVLRLVDEEGQVQGEIQFMP